jgi:hypothetical protein
MLGIMLLNRLVAKSNHLRNNKSTLATETNDNAADVR